MFQASSMLESVLGDGIVDSNSTGTPRIGANRVKQALSTQKMQEMRRRAAEIEALRKAEMKSNSQPVSSATPEETPIAAGQSDVNDIDPAVPAGLQHAGAASDQNIPAERLPVPVAAKPVTEDAGHQRLLMFNGGYRL
jgi:hypothetical protein